MTIMISARSQLPRIVKLVVLHIVAVGWYYRGNTHATITAIDAIQHYQGGVSIPDPIHETPHSTLNWPVAYHSIVALLGP